MDYVCPKGHHSTDPDYCSECGAKIAGAPSGIAAPRTGASGPVVSAVAADAEVCPDCGTRRASPNATFCEICRYNFVTHTSWSASQAPSLPTVQMTPVQSASGPSPAPVDSSGIPGAQSISDPGAATPIDVVPAPVVDSAATPPPVSTAGTLLLRWEITVAVDPSLDIDPDPQRPCPTNEPERLFPLDLPENLIGRRSERKDIYPEISLNDPGVSHRHAKLIRQPDGTFVLLDVGSTNGTQLNGADVPSGVRTPLKDGDQITVGCWTRITLHGVN